MGKGVIRPWRTIARYQTRKQRDDVLADLRASAGRWIAYDTVDKRVGRPAKKSWRPRSSRRLTRIFFQIEWRPGGSGGRWLLCPGDWPTADRRNAALERLRATAHPAMVEYRPKDPKCPPTKTDPASIS